MKNVKFEIDLDELREVVATGVRRTSVFMGIGTNAARIDPPISHVLKDQFFVSVPFKVSAETSKEFAREFENWVIANGFRELVETFSHFLTLVYRIHYLFTHETTTLKHFNQMTRQFEYKGMEEQLEILTELLTLDGRFSPMFASLNQARNCMAHRRGVVDLQDVPNPDQAFVLLWRTHTLILDDGHNTDIPHNIGEGIHVKEGQKISFVEVEREKSFNLGHSIRLSRRDLSEICFGVTVAMEYVRACLIDYGSSKGHTITDKTAE